MSRISFCIAGFSWPTPTISKACTSGMPAASMVESWRLKIAMSPGVVLPPAAEQTALLADLRRDDVLAPQVRAHVLSR